MKLIRAHEHKIMPWKNGLGTTAEIDIFPKGADFIKGDFDWRLSSAQVTASNQFSQFPGHDRWLMVLRGEGMMLNSQPLLLNQIVKFPGEDKIMCSLLGGPVEDLGVIFNRNLYDCEMKIVEVNKKMNLKLPSALYFFKPLSEGLSFSGLKTELGDIVKIEGAQSCEIDSSQGTARVLQISLKKLKAN